MGDWIFFCVISFVIFFRGFNGHDAFAPTSNIPRKQKKIAPLLYDQYSPVHALFCHCFDTGSFGFCFSSSRHLHSQIKNNGQKKNSLISTYRFRRFSSSKGDCLLKPYKGFTWWGWVCVMPMLRVLKATLFLIFHLIKTVPLLGGRSIRAGFPPPPTLGKVLTKSFASSFALFFYGATSVALPSFALGPQYCT